MVLNQNNYNYFNKILKEIEKNQLYRKLKTIDIKDHLVVVDKKYVAINFCSNDYLGLSSNREIIKDIDPILSEQISQCSSRLISGNSTVINSLEVQLSKHREAQSSLVYPSGYMANIGVLSSISNNETTIFSDELNHASIIDGCKLSKGKIQIYPHNDVEELEQQVKKNKSKIKIIVTEGLFSMDGDFANLKDIKEIAFKNDCILIIDDAHADFIIGNKNNQNYSGTPAFFQINDYVDIHISSLSKGLGCFGGYVATNKLFSEFLINRSRSFIFTSALPNFFCKIAENALELSRTGIYQHKLYENIDFFHKIIKENTIINIQENKCSPIIPIIIGSEKKTLEISVELLKKGFFVQAIRFPTVKKNTSRLRISLSANHNKEQIFDLIDNLSKAIKIFI